MSSSLLSRDFLVGAAAGAGVAIVAAELLRRSLAGKGGGGSGEGSSTAALSTTSSGHSGAVYETDKAVAEYLQFHFGADSDILPYADGPRSALRFASRTADLCIDWSKKLGVAPGAALDVGCAVGRTAFDLSRVFGAVVGIDFSHAFIRAANDIKAKGVASYECTAEGVISERHEARMPEGVNPARVTFMQGDACDLPSLAAMGGVKFNVVHAANLLCRLPDPRKFLARLPAIVADGGIVVFVSPFSWLPQYTPQDKWLGGYTDATGTPLRSRDGLIRAMTELGFELAHEEECPFLIREHARKFQWGCSHVNIFRKR